MTHSDQYRFPYEPTPYPVLERLSSSGHVTKKNTLIDYGCGKGRVSFFLSWQTRCKSIGIEYDERIFRALAENRENAVSGSRVEIFHAKAETFDVPQDADRCYFFNPFSIEILQAVIGRIRTSWYELPRGIELFFYYPSDEYTSWLMSLDGVVLSDEILCTDLFEGNDPREKYWCLSCPVNIRITRKGKELARPDSDLTLTPVLQKMSFILRPLPQRASARHTRRFHKCNAFVEGRKR